MIALLLIMTAYGILFPVGASFSFWILRREFQVRARQAVTFVAVARLSTLLVGALSVTGLVVACWMVGATTQTNLSFLITGISATAVEGASRKAGRFAVAAALVWYFGVSLLIERWTPTLTAKACVKLTPTYEKTTIVAALRRAERRAIFCVTVVTFAIWHEVLIGAVRR